MFRTYFFNIRLPIILFCLLPIMLLAFQTVKKKIIRVYLIGDSTMADYTLYEEDYQSKRYPLTGWGQVFQPFLASDSLPKLKRLINGDSVLVVNKARGGRSTRTFFEEGRWATVYKALKKDDLVLIQFGHNDASENKPERYVNIEGYKEYLRLYVNQSREKGAIPIILTPVARNYPWKNNKLLNVHGAYPQAAKEVARELKVSLIDLNKKSRDFFTYKGQEYSSENYFMNLAEGIYEAYPEGLDDNTHFQPEGAMEVARLVFKSLQELN